MTRRRPSEISRDWRGEIAGQISWAPGITVMRSRAIVFERGECKGRNGFQRRGWRLGN